MLLQYSLIQELRVMRIEDSLILSPKASICSRLESQDRDAPEQVDSPCLYRHIMNQ